MDSQKYLILVKGEDKTEEIQNYENGTNYVNVNYKNATNTYTYLKKDFEFYKNPTEIDMKKNRIYFKQGYVYNIVKVLKFDIYYKIFFENDSSTFVKESNVNIVQSDEEIEVSSSKFEYFKEISKIVSVKTEEGIGLLTKEYEKINFIEKNTALYKYMTPFDRTEKLTSDKLNELIFPFGANKSQFNAVRNAMNNQISIIEGPPRNRKNSNNIEYYCKYYEKRTNCCSGVQQ